MRFKIFLLIIILLAVLIGYKIFSGEKPLANIPLIGKPATIELKTLEQQAAYLKTAYLRKHSLGFDVQDITLNEEKPQGLLAEPTLINKDAIKEGWKIGKGQLIGSINIDAPDVAFYIAETSEANCPKILESAIATLAEWETAFDNARAIFIQDQDIPNSACFKTEDDMLIFYQLVYVNK